MLDMSWIVDGPQGTLEERLHAVEGMLQAILSKRMMERFPKEWIQSGIRLEDGTLVNMALVQNPWSGEYELQGPTVDGVLAVEKPEESH